AGPRVYAKMAEDGVFPNIFSAATRGRLDVPMNAIWLQVALAVIVVSFSNLQSLLDYLGFTLSVSAALTVACLFWSRVEGRSSVRSLMFALIAGIYVAATIGLATLSAINRPQQLIGFAVTVLSGLVLFTLFRRGS
ncbi:MAG: APC family permease, partial [Pirellulaceae bacterium]